MQSEWVEGWWERKLTYAHILVFELRRRIAEVAQLAELAVLPPSVVLTAHANDGV